MRVSTARHDDDRAVRSRARRRICEQFGNIALGRSLRQRCATWPQNDALRKSCWRRGDRRSRVRSGCRRCLRGEWKGNKKDGSGKLKSIHFESIAYQPDYSETPRKSARVKFKSSVPKFPRNGSGAPCKSKQGNLLFARHQPRTKKLESEFSPNRQ